LQYHRPSKKFNYALQEMSKADFVKAVTEGLSAPPKYFFMDAAINKKGYDSIDEVMKRNAVALDVKAFEEMLNNEMVIVLDTRTPDEFEKGFIPGSINIGLNGQYAPWVGAILNPEVPLLLVTENGSEDEAVLRLARVGYENVKGYLKGGIAAWKNAGKEADTVSSIEAADFSEIAAKGESQVLDVRKPGEWASGVVEGAELIDLTVLNDHLNKLNKENSYIIYCGGGYRSMIAISLLKKNGFGQKLINVYDGMGKLREAGVKTVQLAE
nr:rhodanese-like domain-containing protein [Bacteroidota bacterium]